MEARLIRGISTSRRALRSILESMEMKPALERAASELERTVKEALSHPAGSNDHTTPWLRTGALRASISHQTSANEAVIGSSEPIAVDQELGTRGIPPRPFLATSAAERAPDVASAIADQLRQQADGRD